MTPENAMKWESTEPSRNNFTFAGGDAVVDFAKKHKQQIHCHTFVWHSQLPTWVSEGGFDNKTLIGIMENHIKNVAGRWKGACTRWDVVNEALNEDGTYRKSVFLDTIGEAYIPIAFRLAAKYAKGSKLYYNDYNLEYNGAKTEGAKRIVKLIKSYGVKIDGKTLISSPLPPHHAISSNNPPGVGYQAHLSSEATPTAPGPTPEQSVLEAALRATSDEGVDVVYTEIDVRMVTPATPEKLKVHAQAWDRIARSCIAVKRCVGMTVWGISDKYSWIPGVFPAEGAALLWDDNYNKKPAYNGFLEGIKKGKKN